MKYNQETNTADFNWNPALRNPLLPLPGDPSLPKPTPLPLPEEDPGGFVPLPSPLPEEDPGGFIPLQSVPEPEFEGDVFEDGGFM